MKYRIRRKTAAILDAPVQTEDWGRAPLHRCSVSICVNVALMPFLTRSYGPRRPVNCAAASACYAQYIPICWSCGVEASTTLTCSLACEHAAHTSWPGYLPMSSPNQLKSCRMAPGWLICTQVIPSADGTNAY